MVRKGNQQRNDSDQKTANHREVVADSVDISLSEEKEKSKAPSRNPVDRHLQNGGNLSRSKSNDERVNEANHMGSGRKKRQRACNVPFRAKADVGNNRSAHTPDNLSNVRNAAGNGILDAREPIRNDGTLFGSSHNQSLSMSVGSAMEAVAGYFRPSVAVAGQRLGQRLGVVALDVWSAATEWIEQQRPRVFKFKSHLCHIYDQMLAGIKHVYPIIWMWLSRLGQLIFVLSVIWLDCNIRGVNSLLRLGTASFFSVVWCSILSIITMVGFTKALIVMVISALVGVFVGLGLGILILAILATINLWLYGSFWTTALVIFIGGSSFASYHERVALLVTAAYSMYCARCYVGWLGLFLGLNLSFLSSDLLIYFLGNNINEQGSNYSGEQDNQTTGRSRDFYGEPSHSSPADDVSASRRSGEPSTSGSEVELTSEGEVLRLLNCNDHYSALGFTRFENMDVSLLKREYRKKAMLVHPDKNMGNEKAAEAFKKLQNAYEVLLDTLKRKTYDDELRREELLNYFRRFQTLAQKNRKNNIFRSGSPHFEPEDEGSPEESRRIACKKCGDFHKWTRTERSKSRARWCQDCNDFHPAKDGDGWLEQSLRPFLFGLLHKVDAPCAYVCAESRIYNATEWFICQGMRCPANTHKASFHVNTSLTSKPAKGSSSSNRGGADESMTEEELFEWLQNAMQSGAFEASGGLSNESPSSNYSNPFSKNSGSSKGNGTTAKKKKKGKKQW